MKDQDISNKNCPIKLTQLALRSQTIVFQELYGGKTEISHHQTFPLGRVLLDLLHGGVFLFLNLHILRQLGSLIFLIF